MLLKPGQEFVLISEGKESFTATLGNISSAFSEDTFEQRKIVLLREIKDHTGYTLVQSEWFKLRLLVELAKKNLGKSISFDAYCRQSVVKGNKGPELLCEFKRLSNIQLLD